MVSVTLAVDWCVLPPKEGRCKATRNREFNLSWREAGPPDNHDDKVVSGQ